MPWYEALIPLCAVFFIFGVPVITYHQRKMAEIKYRHHGNNDTAVLEELRSLREQMMELRDTTTRYDMSFDSALQRIESRVGHLEGRVTQMESTNVNQQA